MGNNSNQSQRKVSEYLKDYSYEYDITRKGKLKKIRVYVGAYFDFAEDKEIVTKYKIIYAFLTIAASIIYVSGLFTLCAASTSLWVAVPHIIIAFPLIMMISSVFRLIIFQPPYDHITNDGIIVGIRKYSGVLLFVSSISLALDIGFIAIKWSAIVKPADFIFGLTILGVTFIAYFMYKFREKFATYQI